FPFEFLLSPSVITVNEVRCHHHQKNYSEDPIALLGDAKFLPFIFLLKFKVLSLVLLGLIPDKCKLLRAAASRGLYTIPQFSKQGEIIPCFIHRRQHGDPLKAIY